MSGALASVQVGGVRKKVELTKTSGTDPLSALHSAMAFSSMDWGGSADVAWIHGIAVGWDGPAMKELATRFNWPPEKVARLRKLRRYFRAAELAEERRGSRQTSGPIFER